MISEMSCVEVVGPLDLFPPTVDTIQETGVLHIVETPLAEFGQPDLLSKIHLDDSQARERETCESTASTLDEIVAAIPAHIVGAQKASREVTRQYVRMANESLDAFSARAAELHAKVKAFLRRERNLTDDINSLASYEKVLSAFAPLVETRELPRDFETVGIVFERKNKLARDMLRQQVERLTAGSFRFLEAPLDGGRVSVLLGFPRRDAQKVRAFVASAGIGEMVFPPALKDKPFEEAFAALESDLASLMRDRRALREQMEDFFGENAAELFALRNICHDRLAHLEALPKFARTRHAFIIQGWVIREGLAGLAAALRRLSAGSVMVRELPTRVLGTPPVLLANPQPVKSFEPLLSFIPLPKYGTLDPTKFLATFFPPMFGLMLGDIGYGAIILAIAGLLTLMAKGRKLMKSIALVAASCGFFTTAFGFLFGELFGEAGKAIGLHPLWRERFSLEGGDIGPALLGYLMIAVGVGVLHIIFGLVLGVINARRTKDRNMALGNLARIAGLAVLFFFVGRLARVLPPVFTSLGIIALVVFLVLLITQTLRHPTHAILMPLEILSTMGNILSYARIMAIGMASVVLSLLANLLGGLIGNFVLAALIVVLVHALNLVLGIIDPTIQALRLHYVEFFSKFYLGGGVPFTPFKKLGGVVS